MVSGAMQCENCGKIFYSSCAKSHFLQHWLAKHSTKPDHLICEICSTILKSRTTAPYHFIAVHKLRLGILKQRKRNFSCDGCLVAYSNRQKLEYHLSSCAHVLQRLCKIEIQRTRPSVTCDECGRSSSSGYHLAKHWQRDHMNENAAKMITCDACGYQCVQRQSLQRHINSKVMPNC